MADALRNMPRYIRNTDAFGWQGADHANGPWRSITPPQSGSPFMTTPMDDYRQASAEVSGVELLSPAAQAVLDALNKELYEAPGAWEASHSAMAAVALRAAVKQAMPVVKSPWSASMNPVLTAMESRDLLLAIANELEGAR